MWIIIAILAHSLFALSAVGDKLLFSSSTMKNPGSYAALVGLLGGLVVVGGVLFGFPWPGMRAVSFAAVAGILFVAALFPYFSGIKKFEATRIVPATGAFVPLFSLLFTALFLPDGASLSIWNIVAFLLMLVGGITLSWDTNIKMPIAALYYSIIAAMLFAGFFVVSKAAFLQQEFWSGLLWSRLAGAIFALTAAVVLPSVRKALFSGDKVSSGGKYKAVVLVILVQAIGAVGGLCESWAVFLAPSAFVPFVNAIQGVQYAMLVMFGIVLSRMLPRLWKERMSGTVLQIKLASIGAIIVGLFILSLHA